MLLTSDDRFGRVQSPLSSLPPVKVRDLPKAFILDSLESYHGARPPDGAVETDYSMWRCRETGLEFAWPMLPGNVELYEWLSSFAAYYPAVRWEYEAVRQHLEAQDTQTGRAKVLDVGCGKGNFLAKLDFLPRGLRYGIDLNEPGVAACRQQGFQAFCGTIDAALDSRFLRPSEFSAVTSFHCLEHVGAPVDFVRSLAALAAPGGRVFISTPYSPMSFEADWFDVLNHPPHHLTRWNLHSYRRLADILGLQIRCFFPPSALLKQALMTFRLLQYGPHRKVRATELLSDALRRLPVLLRAFRAQLERGRRNGGTTADVVLVELTAR